MFPTYFFFSGGGLRQDVTVLYKQLFGRVEWKKRAKGLKRIKRSSDVNWSIFPRDTVPTANHSLACAREDSGFISKSVRSQKIVHFLVRTRRWSRGECFGCWWCGLLPHRDQNPTALGSFNTAEHNTHTRVGCVSLLALRSFTIASFVQRRSRRRRLYNIYLRFAPATFILLGRTHGWDGSSGRTDVTP